MESSQHPRFDLLGAPAENKKHVIFEGGHLPERNVIIKEALDWLDRYPGPVELKK